MTTVHWLHLPHRRDHSRFLSVSDRTQSDTTDRICLGINLIFLFESLDSDVVSFGVLPALGDEIEAEKGHANDAYNTPDYDSRYAGATSSFSIRTVVVTPVDGTSVGTA